MIIFRPVLLFFIILRTDSLSFIPGYLILMTIAYTVLHLKLGKRLAFLTEPDGGGGGNQSSFDRYSVYE